MQEAHNRREWSGTQLSMPKQCNGNRLPWGSADKAARSWLCRWANELLLQCLVVGSQEGIVYSWWLGSGSNEWMGQDDET